MTTQPVTLVADEDGEFFGIPGHHSPRTLLRRIIDETGMPLREVVWDSWAEWCAGVTQGYWKLESKDDWRTWSDATWKSMCEDRSWPFPEFDDIYMPCRQDDPRAMAATYWSA